MIKNTSNSTHPAKGEEVEFEGYCIDLLKEIKEYMKFEYEIYLAPENSFGYMDASGMWSGMIGDLLSKVSQISCVIICILNLYLNIFNGDVPQGQNHKLT